MNAKDTTLNEVRFIYSRYDMTILSTIFEAAKSYLYYSLFKTLHMTEVICLLGMVCKCSLST